MASIPTQAYAQRAESWQLRNCRLEFNIRQPKVMGIVNVTPDSFSDGAKYFDPSAAVDHALALVEQGADLLDIGGESTRPYSQSVTLHEELLRVLPVIEQLIRQTTVPISIDTSKAEVAHQAVLAGAEIINDVTGLTGDPKMYQVALETSAGVCAMHMQGTPQTMQDAPVYQNVVTDILHYLDQRKTALIAAGLTPERVCLDPGIGFGKTHQHNLDLMANCWAFHTLGQPLLVGHSRKGFIAKLLGSPETDRTAGTIGAALALALQQVQVIRVHDVAAVKQALNLFAACGGIDGQPGRLEA